MFTSSLVQLVCFTMVIFAAQKQNYASAYRRSLPEQGVTKR